MDIDIFSNMLTEANNLKWTRETCAQEVQNYSSLSELRYKNPTCYAKIIKNNWHDLLDIIRKPREIKWTQESCAKEVEDYSSISELRYKNPTCYAKIITNNWHYLLDNIRKSSEDRYAPKIWTKEACAKEAAKYSTRQELSKNNRSCFVTIHKNGWSDLMPPRTLSSWTREDCENAVNSCSSMKELNLKFPRCYDAIKRNGWQDLLDKLKLSPEERTNIMRKIGEDKRKWTREVCEEEVKKYSSIGELARKNQSCYAAINKFGYKDLLEKIRMSQEQKTARRAAARTPTPELTKEAVENDTFEIELIKFRGNRI
jgi:hypothetical protein